jgi:hypothetical protein
VSALDLVLGVIGVFFVIGIAVGVIAVIAMSAIRARRGGRDEQADNRTGANRPGGWPGSSDGGPGWEEPPGPDETGDGPRWPAGPAA